MQKLFQTVALAALKWDETMHSAGGVAPVEAPMAVNVVTPAVMSASVFSTPYAATAAAVNVREQLDKMTGGNEKLARSLVQTLLSDAPKTIAQIESAVRGKKAAQLANAAHLLKGSLAIFGAPAAVEAARRLQNMGRAGKLASAPDELSALKKSYEALAGELKSAFPAAEPVKKKAVKRVRR
jgi:HPt (histidine-containing phosphotransfer) domain-containing protein